MERSYEMTKNNIKNTDFKKEFSNLYRICRNSGVKWNKVE
jgi:hypothetical protein